MTELSEYSPEMFKSKNYIDEDEDEENLSTKSIKKNLKEEKNDNPKKRGRPKKSK